MTPESQIVSAENPIAETPFGGHLYMASGTVCLCDLSPKTCMKVWGDAAAKGGAEGMAELAVLRRWEQGHPPKSRPRISN